MKNEKSPITYCLKNDIAQYQKFETLEMYENKQNNSAKSLVYGVYISKSMIRILQKEKYVRCFLHPLRNQPIF